MVSRRITDNARPVCCSSGEAAEMARPAQFVQGMVQALVDPLKFILC